MKICIAGTGAFGMKHLSALQNIEGVEIASIVGRQIESAASVANKHGIPHWTNDLAESLSKPDIEAVILTTPTQLHADQSVQCLHAGKHVMVEIPMADTLADSERILAAQKKTNLIAMAGHTRRFNPSHQWVHNKIQHGEFNIQQMDVQTYFFRRKNINAEGKARSWTDHLLWHHACHTVDLFQHQTGELISEVYGLQGPLHPELGISMDMSIIMKVPSGALCTLSLSFNNDGPLGTFFRYIGDTGTYIARYDELIDGRDTPIDLSGVAISSNGIELQDREFINAIREKREPNASINQCLPAMKILHQVEQMLQ